MGSRQRHSHLKKKKEIQGMGKNVTPEFDIASLRIGTHLADTTNQTVTEITVGYPGKMDYVRTPDGQDFRGTFLYLDDPRSREGYIIHPDFEDELAGDASLAEVALMANQHGDHFVWVVKQPAYEGEPYGASKLDALDRARNEWVRLRKRQDRQGYDVLTARGTFPEPEWPDKSFDEILADVFAGRIVTSLDHPIIKRLRGEAA